MKRMSGCSKTGINSLEVEFNKIFSGRHCTQSLLPELRPWVSAQLVHVIVGIYDQDTLFFLPNCVLFTSFASKPLWYPHLHKCAMAGEHYMNDSLEQLDLCHHLILALELAPAYDLTLPKS